MMDHDLITKNNTAERYLLNELTEPECDAFEEHYFDCPQCAEKVHCGAEFMEYGREVLREEEDRREPVPPSAQPWMRALQVAVFAVVILGVGIGLHRFTPAGGSQGGPQASQIKIVNLEYGSRGTREERLIVLGRNDQLVLSFKIPFSFMSHEVAVYQAVIVASSGREPAHHDISSQNADDQTDWAMEGVGALKPGRYILAFRAFNSSGVEIEKGRTPKIPFRLEMQ